MTTKTLERELLDLEKQYWRAIRDKDIDAAVRLTDDSCIVTGAQGVSRIDKKTFEAMMTAAPWTLNEFQIEDDAEVRLINDDAAIVAYKVKEIGSPRANSNAGPDCRHYPIGLYTRFRGATA
jgi:hypothetical protein